MPLEKPHTSQKGTLKPKEKSSLVSFLIQFFVIAALFFAIGFVVGQKKVEGTRQNLVPRISVSNQAPPQNQNLDLTLFWKVLEVLPQKYLDKGSIDANRMLYGAISGMVRSLGDPYTAFLDPKQNESIKSEIAGSYEGVGIQIGFDEKKRLAVIAPLSGTPAEKEGIQAKDLILKIDDRDAFDLTLPEAVDLIRGQAGTKVKLVLQREGEEPYEKIIERAKIDVKTVEVSFKDQNNKHIAVVKVSRFGEKTNDEWNMIMDEVAAKKVDGIIVDMRNNPGGLLDSSVYLAGDFVRGNIVKQQFSDGSVVPLATNGKGRFLKTPLVVLVNEGSASAAEIFAGAIQDDRRGRLVGKKTFGKGTVQDVVELPGGSGLHVTIAKWLTPKGNSIHGTGISPDIVADFSAEDRKLGRDPQFNKAIEII